MNKNNHKLKIFFYCVAVIGMLHQTISASQYTPNIFFFKPSKDEAYLLDSSITYSNGFATSAFDKNGDTVPFLSQYGPEDFLERFIDSSLGPDNLDSAGQGMFSGLYKFQQYRFEFQKNISHKIIIGTIFSFQDISITNINPEFITQGEPLSTHQINYLEKLNQQIPKTITQSGFYEADFFIGYNERLSNFNHIESFTSLLLVDISTPQSMKSKNNSVFQFPCSANIHFGYPVLATVAIEVTNSFTFGFSGLVVPLQPVVTEIPINRTGENNNLLFSQKTRAKINQSPFINGIIYAEINKKSIGLTGTIAYSYAQYLQSKIVPMNTPEFPIIHNNKSIVLDGYSLGALLIQLDIDCTAKNKQLGPIASFFISIPIAGRSYHKTYLFGGACNLELSYKF